MEEETMDIMYEGVKYVIPRSDVDLVITRSKRPAGMKQEIYKLILNRWKELLKRYKKGKLVHLSKVSSQEWERLGGKQFSQKGNTYRKNTEKNV